jgi:hypothetical protein
MDPATSTSSFTKVTPSLHTSGDDQLIMSLASTRSCYFFNTISINFLEDTLSFHDIENFSYHGGEATGTRSARAAARLG